MPEALVFYISVFVKTVTVNYPAVALAVDYKAFFVCAFRQTAVDEAVRKTVYISLSAAYVVADSEAVLNAVVNFTHVIVVYTLYGIAAGGNAELTGIHIHYK